MAYRDIDKVSNEFEFSLDGVCASTVIEAGKPALELVPEVNPEHVVELNVSLASHVDDLNRRSEEDIFRLIEIVKTTGGSIYGGGSLLADVKHIEPRWHRTTSLSQSCARGFLDITSQQIVIGVTDEKFGFDLYDALRAINPALVVLSANSPFTPRDGMLFDTGKHSRRIAQYEELCRHFPSSMWKEMPALASIDAYNKSLQAISDEVKQRLADGMMDPNHTELTRKRFKDGTPFSYFPFDRLEPHQIYWSVRPRPDHKTIEKGGNSLFSLEARIPDMPTSIEGVQMINSFVLGIGYYVADNGPLTFLGPAQWNDIKSAAHYGLDAKVQGRTVRSTIEALLKYAERGLNSRHMSCDPLELVENVLGSGTEADHLRYQGFTRSSELKDYLATRLQTPPHRV